MKELSVPRVGTVGYFCSASLMPHGWYRHNFATTCDWQTKPRWLHHVVGGLNFHLTHHLFPGWSHRHYPALANIIAELAPQYGMSYRCIDYRELLRQQRKFLRGMGQEPHVTKTT
ncbi:fatty acid desaturase [Pseudomonas amygdali]|uniref:fatty acid desaturase n=2 Tax=Pseudomonas amygdali TaxID=47877 RepID=UPI001F226287|nr:fatty acid desaturase [Pseudomonas amygdali]UNO25657.1 fatty acid desaturase [Pseudomonas amygdali pv. aesculi]WGQ00560.1 fatty acid desaturase [Pseudomonas amygdali pv. aesculi]